MIKLSRLVENIVDKIRLMFEKKPELKPAVIMVDVVYTQEAEDLDIAGENACRIVLRDSSGHIFEEYPFSRHLLELFEDKGFIIDEGLWEANPSVKPSEFVEMRGMTY